VAGWGYSFALRIIFALWMLIKPPLAPAFPDRSTA
jgi:hypothetical protein